MKRLSVLLIAAITLFSCSKSSNNITPAPPPDTKLDINVTDLSTGFATAGATVSLYGSLADWQAGANVLDTKTTDATGSARFGGLVSKKYYYYISQGCRNNLFEANSVNTPIPAGELTSLFATISSTGTLRFVNNFSSPVRVDVNGITLLPSLAANTTYDIKMKTGAYNIRIVRLSGGSYDQTFSGALTCGNILAVTFP